MPTQPQFKTIFLQEKSNTNPRWRANAAAILARFPDAEVAPVESHWQIPELFDADPAAWMQTKQQYLVLGVRTTLKHVDNGRSADFIAAGSSNGCLSACQYCYTELRQKLTFYTRVKMLICAAAEYM